MRILFVIPGLHRVQRGAEVAFESVATELARSGDEVTLIGSGQPDASRPYRFLHAGLVKREHFERWPKVPFFRTEFMYEDATFVPGLLRRYRPGDYDVTVTCSFPYVHWALTRPSKHRPAHVYVTQNGPWPLDTDGGEARFFSCDGLVCTNPEYQELHGAGWFSTVIPNGVDVERFHPGPAERDRLGLPDGVPIVLMVSALMSSKRVDVAIGAMASVPDAHLVVAGDGPERDVRVEVLGVGGGAEQHHAATVQLVDAALEVDQLHHVVVEHALVNAEQPLARPLGGSGAREPVLERVRAQRSDALLDRPRHELLPRRVGEVVALRRERRQRPEQLEQGLHAKARMPNATPGRHRFDVACRRPPGGHAAE